MFCWMSTTLGLAPCWLDVDCSRKKGTFVDEQRARVFWTRISVVQNHLDLLSFSRPGSIKRDLQRIEKEVTVKEIDHHVVFLVMEPGPTSPC